MLSRFAAILAAVVIVPSTVRAEANPLFAQPGHLELSLGTGVPYVAIGEVAVGVSSWFTVGALGGLTPTTWGAGLRARAKLFDGRAVRVVAVVPALYYPASKGLGDAPWLLTMPSLLAEHRFGARVRVHAGAGIAAATWISTASNPEPRYDLNAHTTWVSDDDWKPTAPTHGLWETVTVGASSAMTEHLSLFADATAVLDGAALAANWIGGPPAVVTLGSAWAF